MTKRHYSNEKKRLVLPSIRENSAHRSKQSDAESQLNRKRSYLLLQLQSESAQNFLDSKHLTLLLVSFPILFLISFLLRFSLMRSSLSRALSTFAVLSGYPHAQVTRLKNNIGVITEAFPSFRSGTVGLVIDSGSRHDGPDKSGVAHFLEHLIFKVQSRILLCASFCFMLFLLRSASWSLTLIFCVPPVVHVFPFSTVTSSFAGFHSSLT